jgi:hypothetical protein
VITADPELDPLFQDHDALALATTSSMNGRIQIRVGDLYAFAAVAFGSGISMLEIKEQCRLGVTLRTELTSQ